MLRLTEIVRVNTLSYLENSNMQNNCNEPITMFMEPVWLFEYRDVVVRASTMQLTREC